MQGSIIRVKRNRVKFTEKFKYKNEYTTPIDQLLLRSKSYYHYGILISQNEVVHFVGPSFLKRKESTIKIISLNKFLRGEKLEIIKSKYNVYSKEEIVERALSKVGTDFGVYSLTKNNCEHFATWCVSGKRMSTQCKILEVPTKVLSVLDWEV